MNRRRFLAAAGGVAALGGCLGLGPSADGSDGESMADGSGDESTDGGSGEESMDGESGDESMDGDSALHTRAGTSGLADQPFLGPDPFEATAVIVAFEDPSCPNCRRFETGAYTQIKAQWTDAGTASFVFRGFPVVYPWGKPASQALEAAYAHDEDAFWALKDFYYADQSSFTTDNVPDRTRTFLADETDLDAATVVSEAREKAYDDAVQTDLTAGRDAGFVGTPSFLLFRDGAFVTTLTGPKSFSVFQNALQL